MANVKLVFTGTKRSLTHQVELVSYANSFNEIYLKLEENGIQHICLDKPTAVRLVRELKKQIGFLEGGQNG